AAANGALLLAPGTTSGQQKILMLSADRLDGDLGVVGELVPPVAFQFALELDQLATPGCQDVFAAGPLEECQRLLTDHAPVHDPDPLGVTESLLDLVHDGLDGL